MIRADRELLGELKAVTEAVSDFLIGVLGERPVDPALQRELADELMTVGRHLRDAEPIMSYVNGTTPVVPEIPIQACPAQHAG